MSWPLSHEFNEAIQNPPVVFADPDLKTAETVVGVTGLPLPRSGNFADVYQMRGADGREWAVKCFTRPVVGLAERYARISEALAAADLPFTIGFSFLAEGIRVGGAWRPVVKMEWVEGLLFNQVARENAAKPATLTALGQMWTKLCKRLREAGIAHADLQHGNVLMVPGSRAGAYGLKLIDYDGTWVPALSNTPSGESGHPSYQHPARAATRAYSPDVDRFPHLVVATALKALAVGGPTLWDKYDNGDNLLFTEGDYKKPAESKLMRELWFLGDPGLQALVGRLAIACGKPIPQTPWLDQLAPEGEVAPLDEATRSAAAAALGVGWPTAAQPPLVPVPLALGPPAAGEVGTFGPAPLPSGEPKLLRSMRVGAITPMNRPGEEQKQEQEEQKGPAPGAKRTVSSSGILWEGSENGAQGEEAETEEQRPDRSKQMGEMEEQVDEEEEETEARRPGRPKRRKAKRKKSNALPVIGVGVVVLLAVGAIAAVIVSGRKTKGTESAQPKGTEPASPKTDDRTAKLAGPRVEEPKAKAAGPSVYLATLTPFDFFTQGPWKLGVGKEGDGKSPIVVKDTQYQFGISLHPPDLNRRPTRVSFPLGREFKRFKGRAGISDTPVELGGTIVFTVYGDNRQLWESQGMKKSGTMIGFEIDVADVATLTLETHLTEGNCYYCHAVWFDPWLER
jgi:hypothetical protein